SPSWCLCRSHPERREAHRSAGGTIDQVRFHHQSADRPRARARRAAHAARPRRRGDRMSSRRDFITLLGGAAVAWPLAARAQQAERPARIGFLRASPAPQRGLAAFRSGLGDNGFVAGRNYDLVTRWGGGSAEHLEELAAELVKSEVNLIVVDGLISARAVRAVTSTIPIVMAFGADPVRGGVAESLARPGGNVTGVTSQSDVVSGKTFEILREIVPQLSRLAVIDSALGLELFRPGDAQAARTLGITVSYVDLGTPGQFDAALQTVLAA